MAWGVTPDAFVGHSLGEYVAAHLAGVLSFEDALSLVITRSQLMEGLGEDAAMLAVPLPEADVIPLLGSSLSLATVNTRDECVVAGRTADIEALNASLPEDVTATLIPIVAAGHSSLLDPILPAFLEAVRKVSLSAPSIPYVSNLTGAWITAEQATDPQYWVDHLRHTVRFADCVATVLADGPIVLAELGPGHALSSFARRADGEAAAVIPGLRHPNQIVDDTAFSLMSFARLWGAGVDVDLERFAGAGRRRLRLPTYAFQRERFWIEPGAGYTGVTPTVAVDRGVVAPVGATATADRPRRIDDLDHVFWIPSWQPSDAPTPNDRRGAWLVVGDQGDPLVGSLVDELVGRGARASAAPAAWAAELRRRTRRHRDRRPGRLGRHRPRTVHRTLARPRNGRRPGTRWRCRTGTPGVRFTCRAQRRWLGHSRGRCARGRHRGRGAARVPGPDDPAHRHRGGRGQHVRPRRRRARRRTADRRPAIRRASHAGRRTGRDPRGRGHARHSVAAGPTS